jgi:hypothetical protein
LLLIDLTLRLIFSKLGYTSFSSIFRFLYRYIRVDETMAKTIVSPCGTIGKAPDFVREVRADSVATLPQ